MDRLEVLAVAAEAGGRPLHAIVSIDGDSVRPLVTAVLPAAEVHPGGRRARFPPGELLGIVVAEYLRANAVAVPISANDAVERRMGERGVSLQKTRIGSPYVISALDELRRAGTYARIVGWEAQRRIFNRQRYCTRRRDHGKLRRVAARSASLTIIFFKSVKYSTAIYPG